MALRPIRRIEGLRWVQRRAEPPAFTRGRRPRGAKGAGLRFQRAVAQAVPGSLADQWFEFSDIHGLGWASPDVILRHRGVMFVLECKLTAVAEADAQLSDLYLPLIAHYTRRPTHGIVVVRHLRPHFDESRLVTSLSDGLARATGAHFPILHWLGKGPI